MACNEYNEYVDYLINFSPRHAFDAIYCAYLDHVLSGVLLNTMIIGGVMVMYYGANRSVIVPAVLTIITAAALAAGLAGGAIQFGVALLMFGVPTAGLWLIHRLQDRP